MISNISQNAFWQHHRQDESCYFQSEINEAILHSYPHTVFCFSSTWHRVTLIYFLLPLYVLKHPLQLWTEIGHCACFPHWFLPAFILHVSFNWWLKKQCLYSLTYETPKPQSLGVGVGVRFKFGRKSQLTAQEIGPRNAIIYMHGELTSPVCHTLRMANVWN